MPAVLAQHDQPEPFILLEWLAPDTRLSHDVFGEALGRGLAVLHGVSAPHYGLDHDNYIGATPQPNGYQTSWLNFFRERRLWFQVELAARHGYLTAQQIQHFTWLADHLDRWIDERAVVPALLHGDLWSGNVIAGPGGAPALIDPAVYYGDRETDLAFSMLFGRFPASFYRVYTEAWPLPTGHEERRDLYNLYHALNHLNLFGTSYSALVERLLAAYVR